MGREVQCRVVLLATAFIAVEATAHEGAAVETPETEIASQTDAPPDSPVHLQIEGQTECLDPAAIGQSLGGVLRAYEDASRLSVAVVEAPSVNGSAVTLRVMMLGTGEIVLERSFTFQEVDCPSAHRVLLVVLEQFLSGFPISEWKSEKTPVAPPPAPPPEVRIKEVVVERCSLVAEWLMALGVAARFPSPSGALALSTGPDVGTERHGFIGTLGATVGYPHPLENGRYLETYALLGLGWRGSFRRRLQVRILLRGGGMYLKGFGFDNNFGSWRPWVDAQIILSRRLGRSMVGFVLGGSPLQYSVSLADGEEHPLPFLHLGAHVAFPLFSFSKKN